MASDPEAMMSMAPNVYPLVRDCQQGRLTREELVEAIAALGLPDHPHGVMAGMTPYDIEASGEERWAEHRHGSLDEVDAIRACRLIDSDLHHRITRAVRAAR